MKKTLLSILVALSFSSNADSHVHTEACEDAIKASPFSISLEEIKARVSSAPSSSTDSIAVIDLMAFYQPSYASKLGEQAAHARIQHLVDNANSGLQNSGIPARIRLVNAQEITGIPDGLHYNTSADGLTYGAGTIASARIQNPNESFPENAIYESMGADLALYIRDYNPELQPDNSLGFGSLGGELSTVFDTGTLDVTNPLYSQGEYVLAHELGHNFEAGHLTDDGGYTFKPAAHAYECGGHPTIMGPADPNGNRFYSSPDKSVNGQVCGIAGVADNTSVIKEHAPLAAARRTAPVANGVVSLQSEYKITEGDTEAAITITRTGDTSVEASVQVALYDLTAKEGQDFLESYERVVFAAGNNTATFNVSLGESPEGKAKVLLRYPYKLELGISEAEIIFSEEPANVGVFGFSQTEVSVSEAVGTVELKIIRATGSDGDHAVRVYTEDGARKSGVDYVSFDKEIVFADGEIEKSISVQITDNNIVDSNGNFMIKLDGQGADLNGSEVNITLINNDSAKPVEPPADDSKGGGSTGGLFMLLLSLLSLLRVNGGNASRDKKFI